MIEKNSVQPFWDASGFVYKKIYVTLHNLLPYITYIIYVTSHNLLPYT